MDNNEDQQPNNDYGDEELSSAAQHSDNESGFYEETQSTHCFESKNEPVVGKGRKSALKKALSEILSPRRYSRRLRGIHNSNRDLFLMKTNVLHDIQESIDEIEQTNCQIVSESSFSSLAAHNSSFFSDLPEDESPSPTKPDAHLQLDLTKRQINNSITKLASISNTDFGKRCVKSAYEVIEKNMLIDHKPNHSVECQNAFHRLIYHKLATLCAVLSATRPIDSVDEANRAIVELIRTGMTCCPPQKFLDLIN